SGLASEVEGVFEVRRAGAAVLGLVGLGRRRRLGPGLGRIGRLGLFGLGPARLGPGAILRLALVSLGVLLVLGERLQRALHGLLGVGDHLHQLVLVSLRTHVEIDGLLPQRQRDRLVGVAQQAIVPPID